MWKVTKRKQTVNGKEVGEKITKHNYLGTITVIFQYSNEFSLTVNYKVRIILMTKKFEATHCFLLNYFHADQG